MAKRNLVYTSIYASNAMTAEQWEPVARALKAAGIDWDGDWETVRCSNCDSKYDCECRTEVGTVDEHGAIVGKTLGCCDCDQEFQSSDEQDEHAKATGHNIEG